MATRDAHSTPPHAAHRSGNMSLPTPGMRNLLHVLLRPDACRTSIRDGFVLIFMALLTYLTDAHELFAAYQWSLHRAVEVLQGRCCRLLRRRYVNGLG